MKELSDKVLVETLAEAKALNLDSEFISIVENELKRRRIVGT
ncbi:sporulation histidine kinase inhibitor Sda [Virgibacillus phasianinus]|uniref:Sporulation histidine kinase inhibitor Sda n=1 Tax=Virgibacillus phasianinus TaxID=2017483 RepID=A0A220U2F1_9BACI|nr:sporulation histidine kinase inhibitor Sda [Virgibacillus phasianinus]ASK62270.1 sporulation histidine kinase inhibitor Sda [Virgibacillus phasianinus]